jgi:hypothetical protein
LLAIASSDPISGNTNRGITMKNISRITGTVTDLKRLKSSYNGNPRYSFVLDGYTIKTPVDSSFGYSISNYENKVMGATIGTHYNVLCLNSIEF